MTGASMTPMPQIDMACAWRSRGYESSISAWLIGTIGAENIPWSARKTRISSIEVALPDRIEKTAKPARAPINRRLRPSLPASQPVADMVMACIMK